MKANTDSNATAAYKIVTRQVETLEKMRGTPQGKAALANLRKGLGKSLSECPDVWGWVLERIPEEKRSSYGVSELEEAIYGALTLYALAAQTTTNKQNPVHEQGKPLAAAVGHLVSPDESNRERIGSRLKYVISSRNAEQMAVRLRSLITLVFHEGGPVDFGQLAYDLAGWNGPARERIRMNWARDYVYALKDKKKTDGECEHEA